MNSHSWEPTEKRGTYRLRCDVTEAADALAEAVEKVWADLEQHGPSIVPHLMDTDENDGERCRRALAEYRKLRPVASQDARSAERVDQHAALLDELRYEDLMASGYAGNFPPQEKSPD